MSAPYPASASNAVCKRLAHVLGRSRTTNKIVALKKVRMEAWDEGVPATAIREISVLKEIPHENIVQLFDVFVSFGGNLYLVFELLDKDLKQYMDNVRAAKLRMSPDLIKVCISPFEPLRQFHPNLTS